MNQEHALRQELERVGLRHRRVVAGTTVAVGLLALALVGAGVIAWARWTGRAVPGVSLVLLVLLAAVGLPVLLSALKRRSVDHAIVARRIERRFPGLDARLLAAIEQRPSEQARQLGYLQSTVVGEAVAHSRTHAWEAVVPRSKLQLTRVAQLASLAVLVIVLATMISDVRRHGSEAGFWLGSATGNGAGYAINVEPGDTSIERGTSLLVLARFSGNKLPGDVQLTYRDADGNAQQVQMSKSLNDPVFATRIATVNRDLIYTVRYGDSETQQYKVTVFDFPDLKQADANLKFPAYTGMNDETLKDVRSVTAVEGTKATITFRLNKAVAEATLVPAPTSRPSATPAEPVKLALADPNDPSVYSLVMDLTESRKFKLQLVDADGRRNKVAPELAIHVNPNRPPELKMIWPARDVDVSALQEMSVKIRASDDFGVKRLGLSYSMSGGPSQDIVLAQDVPAKEKREVENLLSMEKLGAQPDQLLSYYFWAEDVGPDGNGRRTSGDLYFAEVRPFDEIFRQGQQPAGGEQQSEQQNQNGQNGQQAEELAELQKQIIAATWKVMRRETSAKPSAQFAPDVSLIDQSQSNARRQAEALGERLEDQRSQAHLANVLRFMDQVSTELRSGAAGAAVAPLAKALASEQAAYQELLKLRAREFDVVRNNQRQQRGQQSASSASSRRQEQLDQLRLDEEQNRYETQRAANAQEDNPQQRETRQVLNRLRELAQRQEDLNRQMRELQSALQQAREEQQREEIKRQLARLRDQQQQQLRDTDELRDRMDQPENQERMADSRQQLEQTREDVRRASESLEQGELPEAASAGARAGEQLNNLRDEFRKSAAGQFNEAMNQMRQDARDLDQNQKQIAEQLSQLDNEKNPEQHGSLRGGAQREQVAKDLGEQKQQLERLMESMRKTIDEAEPTEPLLSKQLYDTVRQASQQQTDQALDAGRQLVERGFTNEARQAESDAGKGIAQLRDGVEQAARSVLGDEAEALRRARNELDQLSQQLQRELDRNRPAEARETRAGGLSTQPATRPGSAREQYARGDSPSTRESRRDAGSTRGSSTRPISDQERVARGGATTRDAQQRRDGNNDSQSPTTQQRDQLAQSDNQESRSDQRDGQRAGSRGEHRDEAQARAGAEPSRDSGQQQGEQPGQQQDGRQPREGGQQPGESQQAQADEPAEGRGDQPGPQGEARNSSRDRRPTDPTLERIAGGGQTGPRGANERGVVIGDEFVDWSDRLRDVEEMVTDPRFRAEAARIRERVRQMRADFTRHSKAPNWDLVDSMVAQPLVELRDAVADELLRHNSKEAMVPIDREPVPPKYADQVRRYYERLGSGR